VVQSKDSLVEVKGSEGETDPPRSE